MRLFPSTLLLAALLAEPSLGFEKNVLPVLEQSCLKCHGGEKVKGKVDFSKIRTTADADANFDLWQTVAAVIEDGEMPPDDEPPLSASDKATVLDWYQHRQQAPVEARPATFKPRRLSGPEYRNTLRSLFGFDLEVTIAKAEQTSTGDPSLVLKLLPTDPPGASGFVNDTHTTPLSTNTWDAYSQLTDAALEKLFSRSTRPQFAKLTGTPIPDTWKPADFSPTQAETLIRHFVPRAFRRPVPDDQLNEIIAATREKSGHALVAATKFQLKAVLMSPAFLYRGLLMPGEPGTQQPVDNYELAERLSYFLWGDRPDAELTHLAATGKLADPETIATQVERMLASTAARNLAENFAVQWLVLNNLDELLIKDPIRLHALKTQPVDFLNYLFTEDRPVIELIDSTTTFVNQGTSGFYRADRKNMTRYVKPKGIERMITQNQRLTIEHTEGRGGILTMPGILTMNHGPIQRGTWMLRRILGEQLGEPPADVPPIMPVPRGKNMTFRERFEAHRSDPSCARCHVKIDPLGFSLDAYDAKGEFTLASDKTDPKPVDTSGQLPSGEYFKNFSELKSILVTSQRQTVVRNIVNRTLSYALCRKLGRHDQPTVDTITENICATNGTWKNLFIQIANSLPFTETIIAPPTEP